LIYLIDGHNLIPKIPGLNLQMVDDEERLVKLLQIFARVRRATVEVYFDQAPPGFSGTRRMGTIKAHFVSKGITADQEIIRRVQKMKKEARGISVVTSDRRIRTEAADVQARLISSELFADQIIAAVSEAEMLGNISTSAMNGGEVDEWLKLFGAEDE
jgi:predicted RNA-binding protein with PIN domain